MFFENDNINANILSTHELKWQARNENSDIRQFHALSFRINGNAEFTFNDESVKASTGDILFVPAYCRYRLKCESEHLIVIHFETNDPLPEHIKVFKPENSAYFKRKFEELHSSWTKKQIGYIYECKSAFYKILMHIESEYMNIKSEAINDRIKEAVDFIHDNFQNDEFSIDELAKLCNMSGAYFRRLFQKKYKTSPLSYINKLKLQLALELLQSGYYTISEISEKCGFKNIYYFSNFIKKETGLPPSKIQKKQ